MMNDLEEYQAFLSRTALIGLLLSGFVALQPRLGPRHAKDLRERVWSEIYAGTVGPASKEIMDKGAKLAEIDQEKMAAELRAGEVGPATEKAMNQAARLLRVEPGVMRELYEGKWGPETEAAVRQKIKNDQQMNAILNEAKEGIAGPAMKKYIDEAGARGELDRPFYNGKSLNQIMKEAQSISDRINAMPRDVGIPPEERRPEDNDPSFVVPKAIEQLRGSDPEGRVLGAQTLCDIRFAKFAAAAIPALEAAVRSNQPELKDFAELALKRVKYFQRRREMGMP